MKKREMGGTEITRGSKNVYADIGLLDADKLKIKTDLVFQIIKERIGKTMEVGTGISTPRA